MGPTSTPDPLLMDIYERTIWDFENLRNEMNDLAAAAADTPVEDLKLITGQMVELTEEIKGYEFPLFAASAQSTLYSFSFNTEQCYLTKYAEYINEVSHPEDIAYRCNQAQLFEETLDLYLQELIEINAGE